MFYFYRQEVKSTRPNCSTLAVLAVLGSACLPKVSPLVYDYALVKSDWWTDPQAACEDNSSWCSALVRLAASPPERAGPGSHCSSHPTRGDIMYEMGKYATKGGCAGMQPPSSPAPSALSPCRSPQGRRPACCCSRAKLSAGGWRGIWAALTEDFDCGERWKTDLLLRVQREARKQETSLSCELVQWKKNRNRELWKKTESMLPAKPHLMSR